MQESAQENLEGLSAKFWLGPYAIILATLYLWGYWSSFHVNVLEHISFTEVIKISAYPLLSAFFFLAIGMIISGMSPLTSMLPPGGGRESREGKFLNKHRKWLIAFFLIIILSVYWFSSLNKWIVLPVLFACLAASRVKSSGLLSLELKSENFRSLVIFALCYLIPFSYGRGIMNAHSIISGEEFLYPTINLLDSQSTVNVVTNTQPRYLGRLDDRFFFYDPVKETTLIVAASEIKAFDLKIYRRSAVSQTSRKDGQAGEKGGTPQTQESNRSSGSTGGVR